MSLWICVGTDVTLDVVSEGGDRGIGFKFFILGGWKVDLGAVAKVIVDLRCGIAPGVGLDERSAFGIIGGLAGFMMPFGVDLCEANGPTSFVVIYFFAEFSDLF